MDLRDRKKGWREKQIIEYEKRLERKNLLHSCDPTILVKNPETGKYESWGIRDYKCEYTSTLLRDDVSKWDSEMVGTLELPFPCGKKINLPATESPIITAINTSLRVAFFLLSKDMKNGIQARIANITDTTE